MDTYAANRYQPDVCLSLASEWITQMMVSPEAGEAWCRRAHAATATSEFYARHKAEQAELTSIGQIQSLRQQQVLLTIPAFSQAYPTQALQLALARGPTIQSLQSKKTDKVKLMRIRRLSVVRSASPATLDTLKTEFLRLSDTPRYYLVSVRANDLASHAIAVVSTKSAGWFSPNGYLYYYDPNLKQVVRWGERTQLNQFLDDSLLEDYASINSIWEVARI